MKTYYNQEYDRWMKTDKTAVTVFAIARLFTSAYTRAATMENAINGFKCTCIRPVDRGTWQLCSIH